MIFIVEMTHQAEVDLRTIYEYIAYSLAEPLTAKRQLNRIKDKILSLDSFPERYRLFYSVLYC